MRLHTETQRVTFAPRIPTAVCVALSLGQATSPQGESLRAEGPGRARPRRPEASPPRRAAPSNAELPEGGPVTAGIRPGCAGTGGGVSNPTPPENWRIEGWGACVN